MTKINDIHLRIGQVIEVRESINGAIVTKLGFVRSFGLHVEAWFFDGHVLRKRRFEPANVNLRLIAQPT